MPPRKISSRSLASSFRAERLPQLHVRKPEIMPEVVDQWRPFLRIDVVIAQDELARDVHSQHFHLCGYAAAKLVELLSAQHVQADHSRFQVHRALLCAFRLYNLARHRTEPGGVEFIGLEAELTRLDLGYRILSCERCKLLYLLPQVR